MEQPEDYIKGRGSQINPHNHFLKGQLVQEHWEAIDENSEENLLKTQYIITKPKSIVNKVKSPDRGMMLSMNPYQGCEHGCIYCYARNSHMYWGYSAGLDFERKILVKTNAPELLEQFFSKRNYVPEPIMVSGNTDCYQPAERKFKITRSLLEVFLKYRHPLSMLTKNSLILRDVDLLQDLAKQNLVRTMLSVTSLNNETHHKMEPRTTTPKQRLKAINQLAKNNVPVGVMVGPIVPGLNDNEVPEIIKQAADNGASFSTFTVLRLNGVIGEIFPDWVEKAYPLKADKILNKVRECHNGNLNDSRYFKRTRGDGKIAEMIRDVFQLSTRRFIKNYNREELNRELFINPNNPQINLF